VDPGSSFMGECQPLHVPLHRTRQVPMPPPPVKSGPGGFKRLSGVIPCGKTRTTWCQPTWRGVKETSRSGLRYEASVCRFPSMGLQMYQLIATLCAPSSLVVVALGGSNSTGGFHLGTLSFSRPHGNRGAHFGYGCHIP
jgi:hypothetical protein